MLPILAAAAAAPSANQPDIVIAARAPVSVAELGGSLTLLTADDLARLQAPLLVDVLRLQPGVGVTSNGGPGGFTAVRLRGAEGVQTTVVIDGVKVADTASPGGGFDFATLATSGIARVEILRGPQSLAWGSQALGGVVAIETLDPRSAPPLAARLEAGARSSRLATADLALGEGALALAASGNWQRTDGISAFSERRGGVERDGFESFGGSIRADLRLADGLTLDMRGRFQQADFGIDGFPPPAFQFADTGDRSRSRDLSGSAGLLYKAGAWALRGRVQAAETRRRNYNRTLAAPQTSFRSNGRLERIDLGADWQPSAVLTLAAGLERELMRLETASPSAFDPDPDPFRARATLTGGFLQAILRPVADLSLLAGIRHDDHSRFGGATTLAASGSWAVGGGPVRLRGAFGQGFKAPTLFQLFSDFGNPALAPERAEGVEAGADLTLGDGALRASLTGFQRRTVNQIDFVSCFGNPAPICAGRPFGTYDNVARTRAEGVELALGFRPRPQLSVDVTYDLTRARNRTAGPNDGNALARRPQHRVSVVADWRWPGGASVGTTLAHVSGSFDDSANSRRLEGFVLVDLRASLPLAAWLEATARVTNLTDAAYETVRLYGQPGRQAFAGLRARL